MGTKIVAVTGATGNVGTSVVQALAADERVEAVRGIARRMPAWACPKLTMTTADIARDDLDDLLAGCDVVIHLGWLFQPTRRPAVTWRTNVLGSKRVFESAARVGVEALVCASSVGAYSPRVNRRPVDESWPTDGWPEAAYTREKAYVERLLDRFEYQHPDIRVTRLRPGFVFKRESASQQRRLFAGPFLPNKLIDQRLIPLVPLLPSVPFQIVHADDAAQAYVQAALTDASGAFNVAADPQVDSSLLADLLGARGVNIPVGLARAILATAWRLHMVPASPGLFDAVRRLPMMDTSRARTELAWQPRHSPAATLTAFLDGLHDSAGFPTPPLRAKLPGGRLSEVASGVGIRP